MSGDSIRDDVAARKGVLEDTASHFFYSAFQKPVTAIAQSIDSKLVESTRFMDEPTQAEFSSARWHAQQIAAGVGGFIPFVAAMAIARPLCKPLQKPMLQTFSATPASKVLSRHAYVEAGTAGFIHGAFLEPTHEGNGSLLESRLKQGATGATTMVALHGLSNGLARFTGASKPEAGILRKSLSTGAAGTGAGGVSYLTDTAINGRAFDGRQMIETAYTMGFTGGALGAGADGFMRLNMPKSRMPAVDEYVARSNQSLAFTDHYFGWLAKQSISGRLKMATTRIGERLEARTRNEHMGNKEPSDGAPVSKLPARLTLNDYGPLERVELVAKLKQLANSPMLNERAIGSFVDKLVESTRRWEDIAPLYEKVQEAQQKVDRRGEALQNARDWSRDYRPKPVVVEIEGGGRSTRYPDHHRVVKAERRLRTAVAERNQTQSALDAVLKGRTTDLSKAANEWLAEQALPPVHVEARFIPASAGYSQGKMMVHPEVLNSRHLNPSQIGTLFHELVHLHQDVLSIRAIADDLNIGKTATSEQLTALRDKVNESTLKNLDEQFKPEDGVPIEFLENIVKLRDGERLTRQQRRTAERFQAAKAEYDNPPWRRAETAFFKQHLAVQNVRNNLGPYAAEGLLRQVNEDPGSVARQYGFSRIPAALRQLAREAAARRQALESEAQKTGPSWPDETTIGQIRSIFDRKYESMQKEADRYGKVGYDWYMRSPLERQAYPAGIVAYLLAKSRMDNGGER